jgi:uncharacterized repeat protein (TIGR02543 family)
VARVSIFLIAVAFIAGMLGCAPTDTHPTGTNSSDTLPTPQYDLNISSTTGGSVNTPGEGNFTYNAGTVVSLVASPASGYHFVNWTGDAGIIADVNAPITTITINGDYSITANFDQILLRQFSLIIASTKGGRVTTPGEGYFTYLEGTVVSLVATPDAGYPFVKWTGDVGTIANVNAASTNITMQGDYEITASFGRVCSCIAIGPFL